MSYSSFKNQKLIFESWRAHLAEEEIEEELVSTATAVPTPEIFTAFVLKDDDIQTDEENPEGYAAGFSGKGGPQYFYGDLKPKIDPSIKGKFLAMSDKDKMQAFSDIGLQNRPVFMIF